MPDRCVVHGCSNRSNVKAGISAHFSPTIKSERDKWLRFVRTHRANFNPTGKFVVCSVHFAEECFSRAIHMEGCSRHLIPGSVPTIWKIEPEKPSNSKRQHRKVSLVYLMYTGTSFSIVLAMKFSLA